MKCTIIATEEELMLIGVDIEFVNEEVDWVKDYPDGFSVVKHQYYEIDIPKKWLKFE